MYVCVYVCMYVCNYTYTPSMYLFNKLYLSKVLIAVCKRLFCIPLNCFLFAGYSLRTSRFQMLLFRILGKLAGNKQIIIHTCMYVYMFVICINVLVGQIVFLLFFGQN